MIRIKLLGMDYDTRREGPNSNPLNDPPERRDWSNAFTDYLEHGWLRSPLCADLLQKLENARWSDTASYTYLDANDQPHHSYMLKRSTRFALTVAENSRRGRYTWLPTDDLCRELDDVWPVLQALDQTMLVQAVFVYHTDCGLFEAMRRMDAVFEIRYKGRLRRGKWADIVPGLEPTEYSSMRILMAVRKGLAERALPYPDEPLPFTPRCADLPALQGWRFTSVLCAQPYCGNGGTILPTRADGIAETVCLRVTQGADGKLTLEQLPGRAFDYDDLLLREVADLRPGERRWSLVLASDVWYGWPEGALLPYRWQAQYWGQKPAEYDHETADTFGFVLDGDAKTATLSEDAAALQMFRDALIAYRKQV